MLGLLAGAIGKLACCFAMMALFTFSVVSHSGKTPNEQGVDLRLSPALPSDAAQTPSLAVIRTSAR